ncbi:biopolymer transporter ExbD [Puniceicoccaceae bacterium K14]|nr:biopolymer transporter ExbD [Puniceicoccaceae bacterium K14]
MGRSFHRKNKLEAVSELNVTALIDLGFALLIIFMIATPLIENEQIMKVDLPVASESPNDSPPEESKRVQIVVTNTGYEVDGIALTDLEIEDEMARLAAMTEKPILSVRADAETRYQKVITVLDLAKQYKLSKLHMVTRPEE